jgi:anti-sigma factor RsiW
MIGEETMKCDHELLAACVLGDLEESRKVEVESHAASCPACAERLAQLRRALDLIGSLPKAANRPVAMDRLRAEIGEADAIAERPGSIIPSRPPQWRWVFALAAAATLAIVCFRYGVAVRVGQLEIAFGGKGSGALISPTGPSAVQTASAANESAMRDLARNEIAAQVVPVLLRLTATVEGLNTQYHEDFVGLRNALAIQRVADLDEVKRNFGLIASTVDERLGVR